MQHSDMKIFAFVFSSSYLQPAFQHQPVSIFRNDQVCKAFNFSAVSGIDRFLVEYDTTVGVDIEIGTHLILTPKPDTETTSPWTLNGKSQVHNNLLNR